MNLCAAAEGPVGALVRGAWHGCTGAGGVLQSRVGIGAYVPLVSMYSKGLRGVVFLDRFMSALVRVVLQGR